jgi:hypothetical protein
MAGPQAANEADRTACASRLYATSSGCPRSSRRAGWDLRMLLDHLSESAGALGEGLTTGTVDLQPAPAADPDAGLATSLRAGCERLLAACAYAPPP